MKKLFLAFAILAAAACSRPAQVEIDKIWDLNYSSFPSITEFEGKYFVSFREGEGHVFDKNGKAAGRARVLCSSDGKKWESVALLEKEGYDLRDPKISVTPDGRLMLIMGGSVYVDKQLVARIPQVSFSTDGRAFSDPEPVVFDENITDEAEWIWRVTWHEGIGYGVTYGDHFALLKTTDGLHYDFVTELEVPSEFFPNETTVRFAPDGRMLLLVRCEKNGGLARWGVSEAPYTDWEWKTLNSHIGGPDFIVMDDGTVFAGGRYHFPNNHPRTLLYKGKVDGAFEEQYILPSSGDNSYPGFLKVGDELWVVYYSSHESPRDARRASIYLARLPLYEGPLAADL